MPLGCISRVEKVGYSTVSRGEDSYGLEITCKLSGSIVYTLWKLILEQKVFIEPYWKSEYCSFSVLKPVFYLKFSPLIFFKFIWSVVFRTCEIFASHINKKLIIVGGRYMKAYRNLHFQLRVKRWVFFVLFSAPTFYLSRDRLIRRCHDSFKSSGWCFWISSTLMEGWWRDEDVSLHRVYSTIQCLFQFRVFSLTQFCKNIILFPVQTGRLQLHVLGIFRYCLQTRMDLWWLEFIWTT